jgi:hypothetical protein
MLKLKFFLIISGHVSWRVKMYIALLMVVIKSHLKHHLEMLKVLISYGSTLIKVQSIHKNEIVFNISLILAKKCIILF